MSHSTLREIVTRPGMRAESLPRDGRGGSVSLSVR